MKILLVHNDYGKYSGEEAVVDKMADIFASLGHEVRQLRMSTASARESLRGKIRVFTAGIHSPSGIKAMREAIAEFKPDAVNVHNVYPFISPAALRECRRAGVPVVMTIHNFRLVCPTGLFMRDGAPCELCLERGNEWSCLRYNCEGSMLKSVAYASRNAIARRRRHFPDCVDRFACITDFQRRKLIEAGIPAEKLIVIPNPMDVPKVLATPTDGEYVGFCGRISREKGIDLIIDVARRNPDIPFRLAGAVADERLVEDLPANVKLEGYLKGKDLEDFYAGSRFMVMASRWYEGFPMAILEGAKHAKATVGPDHGGFTEIIGQGPEDKSGLLFEPGSPEGLEAAVRRLWDAPEEARRLGEAAQAKLRERFATPVVAAAWQRLLSDILGSEIRSG